MKVRLTKVSSTHNRLRTDEVVGEAFCAPVVGERFEMYAEPLDSAMDIRLVSTSPVTTFDGRRLSTANSVYDFEVCE